MVEVSVAIVVPLLRREDAMASSPNPRYFKDGNGLHPTLRYWLRHPISALRFTPLNRIRVRWNDRHYRPTTMLIHLDKEKE